MRRLMDALRGFGAGALRRYGELRQHRVPGERAGLADALAMFDYGSHDDPC